MLTLTEAVNLAQNWPCTQDAADYDCMALVWRKPEVMTICY